MLVEKQVSLQPYNSFGIAARAQQLARIRSEADVRALMGAPDWAITPRFVLGGGSNLVITGDIKALVLKVEIAGKRLGADVMNMSVASPSVKKGETLIDTAMTLNAMRPDILIIRHQSAGAAALLAQKVGCSVVNAGDGAHEHPTQALLDALTIRRAKGRIQRLTVAICGDIAHSRVARSNLILLGKMENRLRLIAPPTRQRQKHEITQHYIIDDISDDIQVPGTDDNIWYTRQDRIDRDYAAFGELSYDLTDSVTATGGIRVYNYKNSLAGFFGYNNPGFSSNPVYACQGPAVVADAPCTNLDKVTSDTDFIHKLNLTWKVNPDVMVYATWSRGFRPGGINRRGSLPPYSPDQLDNYEIGWKTNLGPVRFNGAIYQQDWDGIQLSFLGANGLSEVRNAGVARIRGAEFDIGYRTGGLSLSLGGSYNDAEITEPFCRTANADFDCAIPVGNSELAPAGTRLPQVPKFKGNAVARYEFPLGALNAHMQGALSHVGSRRTDLRDYQNAIKGTLDSYTTVDFSFGLEKYGRRVELFATNLFDSNGKTSTSIQCVETTCGDPDGLSSTGGVFYDYVIKPRVVGLKVGFDF